VAVVVVPHRRRLFPIGTFRLRRTNLFPERPSVLYFLIILNMRCLLILEFKIPTCHKLDTLEIWPTEVVDEKMRHVWPRAGTEDVFVREDPPRTKSLSSLVFTSSRQEQRSQNTGICSRVRDRFSREMS